jgi:hypothetical protein
MDLPTDPEDHFQVSKGGSGIRPAQLDDPLFLVTFFMKSTGQTARDNFHANDNATKMNLLRYQS